MTNDTWWLDELEREGKPRMFWVVSRNIFGRITLTQPVCSFSEYESGDDTLGLGMTAREALANAFGYSDANDQSD